MENNLRKSDQFNDHSYGLHANWYNTLYPEKEQKIKVIKSLNSYNGSINHWLQNLFFNCLNPFTNNKNAKWLTLGDAYGHDARYLLDQNIQDVTASDLDDSFLKVSHEEEFIKDFSAQNAESLTLEDESVDYILCKESYHHFPRPYAALYEMIRVARKAIIIIEPQDPISKMPSLLYLANLLGRINDRTINKIWKNRFSYEKVGNFVYKVSEREFEKFAAGLNLPMIAIKKINPNFWFPGSEHIKADRKEKVFRRILFRKKIRDLFSNWGVLPSQTLSIAVFKNMPDDSLKKSLIEEGYRLVEIPKNPHIQKSSY
ncbi:class I SAM-dependent methyltransferase [Sphingobacterium athyrii]|uniref:Class I SAM-dependent methyltransferase n=1 Tax=Sphingobacterium athyrii TaxID=2152717 RepID=A0A363NQC4_9SPHI|nr:methyltransferase domain-containing protein [Sphingobacterium athyrii]PUV23006.1 class I SAM-dependent methyltransferase [Sphingobacterium athyrii]